MANDFKRICTPSISDSSNSTIYAVPAGAGSTALESIRYWHHNGKQNYFGCNRKYFS